MSSTATTTPTTPTTGSLEDVLVWIDRMADRGIYNGSSARFKRNAIEQFAEVLGPEEARTATYMSEQIDFICDRWAKKVNSNPETARTYKSRASTALSDYLRYQENPQAFRTKPPKKATPKKPKKGEPAKESDKAAELHEVPTSNARPSATPLLRTFPLGKDRQPFTYEVPEGMVVADVIKIACHLLTMAEDFDPTNAKTSAIFALARRDP